MKLEAKKRMRCPNRTTSPAPDVENDDEDPVTVEHDDKSDND